MRGNHRSDEPSVCVSNALSRDFARRDSLRMTLGNCERRRRFASRQTSRVGYRVARSVVFVGWLALLLVARCARADEGQVIWSPERPGTRVVPEDFLTDEPRDSRNAWYVSPTSAPESLRVPDSFQVDWNETTESAPWDGSLVAPPVMFDEVEQYPLDQLPLDADSLPQREEPQAMSPSRDGRDRAPLSARFTWLPGERFENVPGAISIRSEQLDIAFPLRIRPEGIWLALGGIRHWELNTSALLPDSGLPVPSQLWNIELGTMHLRNFSNGWKGGGLLMVGSPSDQPFAAWRDMTVALLGFVTIPAGPRDAWNLSLFYSPTGQIIFPIPGVAYVWRPNRQLQVQIGIPFSLEYRPNEFWTLTASYQPLTNAQVLLRRSWGGPWSVYAGYRTTSETFLLADRELTRERTYVFDQRLTLGLQRKIGSHWQVDFAAAYVFDRTLFQAEKFSGPRRDELDIEPGLGGLLQISWTR